MAKLGFLASSDSCTEVRGESERFMTHFCLVLSLKLIHVWLGMVHVWLSASVGAVDTEGMVNAGAGAVGAGVVVVLLMVLDVVLELLGGRFCECPLKDETWPVLSRFAEPLVKL